MGRTKRHALKPKKAAKVSQKKTTPSVELSSKEAKQKMAIEKLTKGHLAIESGDYLDAFDLNEALSEILSKVDLTVLHAMERGLERYSGKAFVNATKYHVLQSEGEHRLSPENMELASKLLPHFCKLREAVDEVNSAISQIDWRVSSISLFTGHSQPLDVTEPK